MKKLIAGIHSHGRSSSRLGRSLTLFAPKRKKKRVGSKKKKKAVEYLPELFETPVAMA